jgi:hypothetical protein
VVIVTSGTCFASIATTSFWTWSSLLNMSILTSKPLSAAAILTDSVSQAFDSGRNWVRPQNVTVFFVPVELWAGACAAGLASEAGCAAAGLLSAGLDSAGAAGFWPGAWTVPVQALSNAALAVSPRYCKKARRSIRTVVIVDTSHWDAGRAPQCARNSIGPFTRSRWTLAD